MKFLVDIDKTTPYIDANGISWWGSSFGGKPDILKLYKDLEGQESCGLKVIEVFEEDSIIKAYVECEADAIEGLQGFRLVSGGLR